MLAMLYFSAVGAIFYTLFLTTPRADENQSIEDHVISTEQAVDPYGQ